MGSGAVKRVVGGALAEAAGSIVGAVFALVVRLGLHAFETECGLEKLWAAVGGEARLGEGIASVGINTGWPLASTKCWGMADAIGFFGFGFCGIDLIEDPGTGFGMDQVPLYSYQGLSIGQECFLRGLEAA